LGPNFEKLNQSIKVQELNLPSLVFIFLGMISAASARGGSPTLSFSACIDERPWIPYTNPNFRNPGIMQLLTDLVAADMGMTVSVVALPWKRCLESVRSGKIDAMIGGADVPFTRKLAIFPKNKGAVDTNRSLGTARILLVKRIPSEVDWNGKDFINLSGPVAVAMGTQAMINAVVNAGAVADEGGKTDDQNLRKLMQNRVELMAAYEFDLKNLIDRNDSAVIAVLAKPLLETHYYLAFSKSFYARNSQLAESFWDRIPSRRHSISPRPDTRYSEGPMASASAIR
jgi:polar amino acid transport system substrate-binding protein